MSEQPNTDQHRQTGTEGQEQARGGNREAANYRARLRDAEAERDQLQAELDRLAGEAVERTASEVRTALREQLSGWLEPDGLEAVAETIDPEKFLTEDGEVDPEQIEKYASKFKDKFYVPSKRRAGYVAMPPNSDPMPPGAYNGRTSWADVVRPD